MSTYDPFAPPAYDPFLDPRAGFANADEAHAELQELHSQLADCGNATRRALVQDDIDVCQRAIDYFEACERQRKLTFAFAQKIVDAKIRLRAPNAEQWRAAHELAKARRNREQS